MQYFLIFNVGLAVIPGLKNALMKHFLKVAQILIHNVSCTNFARILKHNVMQRALNYFPSGGTNLRKKRNKMKGILVEKTNLRKKMDKMKDIFGGEGQTHQA